MNKKTLAIYPGSFNPFHCGHQNILDKAEKIFGKENVIISIGINPEKMSVERQEMIKIHGKLMLKDIADGRAESLRRQLPTKNVEWYTDFLTEYVRLKESEGYNVVVIRGLRNGHDYDHEYNQVRFCWDQMPGMSIACLFCDPIFTHVSSSAYRALEKFKPGAGHKYLAKEVGDFKGEM